MTLETKIRKIKLFIKISIVFSVLAVFIVLGFFIKPINTYENSNMKKWLTLSESQQIMTLQQILKTNNDQELLIKCVTKIAKIPDSNEMMIRDAVSLCYNGILINSQSDEK